MKTATTFALLAVLGFAPSFTLGADTPAEVLQEADLVTRDTDATVPPGETLRICTYNIQHFTDGENDGFMRTEASRDRQVKNAAKLIAEINPDVLVIQEIENGKILDALNQALPEPYPVAYITKFTNGRRTDKLNVALLSRHDTMKVRELDMSSIREPVRLSRGALSFAIDLGEGHVLLGYGVHLKSNFGDRTSNIAKRAEVLKVIRAHADVVMSSNPDIQWETMVLGDFNVDPDVPQFAEDPSLEPLAGWTDLWRGYPLERRMTIPTRLGDPALRFDPACFDRLVVGPALLRQPWAVGGPRALQRGVDTENVFTEPGQNEIHVSDHYPAYVDLLR